MFFLFIIINLLIAYSGVFGNLGLINYFYYTKQESHLALKISEITKENGRLKKINGLMSNSSMDQDYLETLILKNKIAIPADYKILKR